MVNNLQIYVLQTALRFWFRFSYRASFNLLLYTSAFRIRTLHHTRWCAFHLLHFTLIHLGVF